MNAVIFKQRLRAGMGAAFLMLCSSCSQDFLEITPNHYLTENSFYKTGDDYIQAVNAVYGDLQKYALQAHFLEEGRSDNTTYDTYLDQGSLIGDREFSYLDQFKLTSNAGIVADAWTVNFNAVKDCNLPLSSLPNAGIDPDLTARLAGELRFLRAYFNFASVRYWGDIPLLLKPVTTAEEAFAIARSPQEEAYQAIIRDAQYADSVLPAAYSGADIGRVTRGAAEMLLAKVYLTRKAFPEAEKMLRQIMSGGRYALLPDYAALFDPANKNNKESIFEVQFKEGPEGESSNFIYQFAPVGTHGTVFVGPGTGGGRNLPTRDMAAAYEDGDLRKAVSLGSVERDGAMVYYIKKYDHDSDPDYARTPDNWPIYRYADVLLMLAEVINEQGYRTGEPFDLLNEVRSRAGLPSLQPADLPDQEAFRKALAHERRVELAFENHRWFDLVRTGKAVEVMTAYGKKEIADPTTPPPAFLPFDGNSFAVKPYMLLYPVPGDELNKDPNIKQNEGY
ncbi:RagB/SusD family nutrient uptake outer membrane protein [Compostibacter hankyongensis]|uniref:RagB/SusD family nutrient uptake outer membrane protein n=1 Tax=Compostibacter hankyongensis TaxID=1007089 RepID=A0ABP8FZJ5_9BACT